MFPEIHEIVKQFGSRSGLTKCRAWSGSKLFATVISRQQKSPKLKKKKKKKKDFLFSIFFSWIIEDFFLELLKVLFTNYPISDILLVLYFMK